MKNKIVLVSFMLFFTALCAGLFAHTKNISQSRSENISKNKVFQKLDQQNQTEIYSVSDIQDEVDANDVEKVQFDYSAIVRVYVNYFFTTYSSYIQPVAVEEQHAITTPRYILYHSLQIAVC